VREEALHLKLERQVQERDGAVFELEHAEGVLLGLGGVDDVCGALLEIGGEALDLCRGENGGWGLLVGVGRREWGVGGVGGVGGFVGDMGPWGGLSVELGCRTLDLLGWVGV
jgi:hypothetical protein